MRRWFPILLLAAMLALLPGAAAAQETGQDGDFLLRVNSPLRVAPDDSVDTAMAVNADGTFDGVVRDTAIVINGTAVVNGRVNGDLTVINGQADLRDGARVNNVALINSTLIQAPGAQVTGQISRSTATFSPWAATAAWFVFWLGMTVATIVAGLLFAAIGGRQLSAAGAFLVTRPGAAILAALILAIGLPILGIVLVSTIVGIPLGLALFLILLPALWFVGYLIAGTRLGAVLLRAAGVQVAPEHPYLAAVVGPLVLQLIGLIPVIGSLVVALAGLYGVGGGAVLAWRAFRTPRTPRPEAPAAGAPAPAP
ncbi:MAG: hypothetical protein QJR03_00640 [Sphaerobacter sp.]|nr:hypothetical protein [Sphaerobacter sp.]